MLRLLYLNVSSRNPKPYCMNDDFDSDFDLPRPTKLKFAKEALVGAAATVVAIGAYFSFALDSFRAALANVGIDATNFPPVVLEAAVLVGLFVVVFLGIYCGRSQYARRQILRLTS
jgi:hypothetical protein